MLMYKAFQNMWGFIRFALMILVALWVFKAVMLVHKRFDGAIPEYTTRHFHKPEYRADPDIEIRWLERIVQRKVEPIIVYDTVFYDSDWEHLIRLVKSDGKTIQVQTQLCGTPMGQDHTYPYMRRYQIVPTPTGIHMTEYKDYFMWTGLSVALRYDAFSRSEVLVKSGISYVPWRIKGQIYITTNGGTGIELEKRFW